MITTVIKIDGMSCAHCVHSVEEALGELAGVNSVSVDLEAGEATVVHEDSVELGVMTEAIEEIGYDVI